MKKKRRSRHHILNKSRGGTKTEDNILLIYREKHDLWHKLFKDRTLREAAGLLLRLARMKERRNE